MLLRFYKSKISPKNLISSVNTTKFAVGLLRKGLTCLLNALNFAVPGSINIRMGKRAFTLLELMIVIAIISVLAAIATPLFKQHIERAEHTKLLATMRMIDREITVFNLANNRLPDSLNELGLGDLRDTWGRPFQYLNFANVKGKGPMRKNFSLVPINSDYDFYSMGPDGKTKPPFTAAASRDDIVRANNGAFFGRVSEY